MLDEACQHDVPSEAEVLDSLADFERNTSDEIKLTRSSTRVRIRSKVIAQPGNSSDRQTTKVQGITGDISAGGCQILFPTPIGVGDIYWLTFDTTEVDLDSIFARCLRCRLIREDAYEAGFKFFESIDLTETVESGNTEALFG